MQLAHKSLWLWILLGFALVELAASQWARVAIAVPVWEGSLAVLTGLFICSQPAAHAIDLLFEDRQALRELTHSQAGWGWLLLNLAVLLAGWALIVVGAIRLGD
jgi:hypothetical protein